MYSLESLLNSIKFKKVLNCKVSNNKGSDCISKYIITPKNAEDKIHQDKCILHVYGEDNIKIEIYTKGKSYKFYRQPFNQILDKVYIFGTETKLKRGDKYFIEEWMTNLNSVNPKFKYYKRIGNYQSYQTYSIEELYRKAIESNLI